jgi:hypothetical protein
MANTASFPGAEIPLLALDMLMGSVGLLLLYLVVPHIVSSMATGSVGDTGESKIGGALAGAAQVFATSFTAWAVGRALGGAAAGGAGASSGGHQTAEQRAQALVDAAAGGMRSGGESPEGPRGGVAGAPRTPAGHQEAAESEVPQGAAQRTGAGQRQSGVREPDKRAAEAAGQVAGAVGRGVRAKGNVIDGEDEDADAS